MWVILCQKALLAKVKNKEINAHMENRHHCKKMAYGILRTTLDVRENDLSFCFLQVYELKRGRQACVRREIQKKNREAERYLRPLLSEVGGRPSPPVTFVYFRRFYH